MLRSTSGFDATSSSSVENSRVDVELDNAAAVALAMLETNAENAKSAGKQLAIVSAGVVLSARVIRRPLSDGNLEVMGHLTPADAEKLAAVLAAPPLGAGVTIEIAQQAIP